MERVTNAEIEEAADICGCQHTTNMLRRLLAERQAAREACVPLEQVRDTLNILVGIVREYKKCAPEVLGELADAIDNCLAIVGPQP
jgi:hypothetical protein